MFTVAAQRRHQLETIKGSRFIATVAPVASEDEARALVGEISAEMSDASHHCTAWRIARPSIDRCSDDGEPSGSAGRPILAQLTGRDLVNTVVVVTRYFGGTKLGVGGLVRAYGAAAAGVLDEATVIGYSPQTHMQIMADYGDAERVQRTLTDLGAAVTEIIYEQEVELVITVAEGEVENVGKAVAEATAGRARIETDEPSSGDARG